MDPYRRNEGTPFWQVAGWATARGLSLGHGPPSRDARVQAPPLQTTGTSTFVCGSTSISRTSSGIAARIITPQIGHSTW